MSLYFCDSIDNIHSHNDSSFLYIFLTKPQPCKEIAYIKLGITESQTLTKRLKQYIKKNLQDSITPTNIYYIQTTKVTERELIIKKLFNFHSDITLYNRNEYFKGKLSLMINIFAYISLAKDDDLNNININNKNIFETITNFNYEIIKLTEIKEYICNEEENNLTEEIKLICSNCNKSCKNKAGLTIHLKTCIESETNCKFCNKLFSNQYNLKRHVQDKSCNGYITYLENELEKNIKENILLNNKLEESNKENEFKLNNLEKIIKEKDIEINTYKTNMQTMLNFSYNLSK